MDFYGQYEIPVDRFLYERYFPDTNIKGFFIECGAFDGTTLSSCRFFEETMGWAGLNVEPAPEIFADLIENRPTSRNLNFGLSDKTGEMTFNRVIYPQLGKLSGLYGSLEPSPFLLDQAAQGLCELEQITVQTLDWNTLIERECIDHVTLLVLDVEGHELSVLAGMAGSRVLPEVICIEFGHIDFLQLRRVMERLNYAYDIHSFGNAFFIRRDVLPLYTFRTSHWSAAKQPAQTDSQSEAAAREQTPRTSLQDPRYVQLESEILSLHQRETELVDFINSIHNSRGWKALETARRVRSFWKRPTHTPPTVGPARDPQTGSAAQPQDLVSELGIDDIVKEAQSIGNQYRDSDRFTLEKALGELQRNGHVDHRFWKALSDYFWSNGPSDYSLLPSELYLKTHRDLNLFFRAGEIHGVRGTNEASRVHYFEEVVRCVASTAGEYLVVGMALTRLRRWDEAFKAYEVGLRLSPNDSELWRALAQSIGNQYRDCDRPTLEKALGELQRNGHVDHRFWKALSDYFWSNGPSDYSLLPSELYLKTHRDLNLFFRAGEIHGVRGTNEASRVHYFEEVVRCVASTAGEYLVVGMALTRLRRWDEAFKAYEAGLRLSPNDSELWRAFAETSFASRSAGNFIKSIETHQANIVDVVVALSPDEVVFFVKLLKMEGEGNICEQVTDLIIRGLVQQNVSEAIPQLIRYIITSAALNEFEFRHRICEGLIDNWSRRDGDDFLKGVFRVKLAKLFSRPFVFEGAVNDEESVRDFCNECQKLTLDAVELDEPLADLGLLVPWQTIYTRAVPHLYSAAALAIHNLCARVWPRLIWTAPHVIRNDRAYNGKIKIGFACFDFMPMMSGLMGKLDAEKFETIYLRPDFPQPSGETGQNWVARADQTVELPGDSIYAIQQAIAREELDIIVAAPFAPSGFYPMMARLAPLQMTLIEPNWCDRFPTSDYYISWNEAESSDFKAYHKNAVALMQHPPYWLEMPSQTDKPVATVVSALADAPAHKRVYLCPTSPVKLHHSFDEIAKKVLLRDPEGILVLLRMDNPMGYCVQQRMVNAFGALAERLICLPSLRQEEAHALLKAVDCVLDAHPLGGMSSSFVSAAVGTPTVSMPKEMPFGKWMSAIYSYIGVEGLTAASSDEYAEIAYRLASNPEWREKKAAEIRVKGNLLIESEASAAELEAFILKAWKRHANGLPPTDWVNDQWAEN